MRSEFLKMLLFWAALCSLWLLSERHSTVQLHGILSHGYTFRITWGYLYFVVLRFELSASHLLVRSSTA
jgi:hypothetical protein